MNKMNTAIEKLRVKDSERERAQREVQNQAKSEILEVQTPTQSETPDITKVQVEIPEVAETTTTPFPIGSGFKVDSKSKVGRVVAAKAKGEPING